MIGQDTQMQHIWITDDDISVFAYLFALVLRCITIVWRTNNIRDVLEPGKLVASKCFCRKQEKSCGLTVFQDCIQGWELVDKRFSRGSSGGDDQVFSLLNYFPAIFLMFVELMDPLSFKE